MAKDITVSWRYSEVEGDPLHDVAFYRSSFPGLTEYIQKSGEYLGRLGGPEVAKVLYWGGSAILSSSLLAGAIKAYVALKKRKITLSIGDKKVEYEGSDLERDQETIEAMIDKLLDDERTTLVTIHAERKY